jgi:hypothetical protein
MRNDAKNLTGTWIADSKSIPTISAPQLTLEVDGKFIASNFPKSVACASSSSRDLMSGRGNWEYDSSDSRIILLFSQYTTTSCTAPYGANVFVESVMFKTKILLFPEGVDKPSAAIVLGKIPKESKQ